MGCARYINQIKIITATTKKLLLDGVSVQIILLLNWMILRRCSRPSSHCFRLEVSAPHEFCHNEQFKAECPPNQVILMTSALYGRMKIGTCVKTDFGFVGCFHDVMPHAHERCSGRQACVIPVPDAILDLTKPCNEDLKSYLETSYICVDGRLVVSGSALLEIVVSAPSGVSVSALIVVSGSVRFVVSVSVLFPLASYL